jgi:peptidoglycan/LPS O-acetylase OafA/YrhL
MDDSLAARRKHGSCLKTETHIGFLDGFRGYAALWVLIAHCSIWGGWNGWHISNPKAAVDVFIFVSGFLMAYQFAAREQAEPAGNWHAMLRFWIRRFFRIAPLFYLVLIAAFLMGPWLKQGYMTLREANAAAWGADVMYDPARIEYTKTNFFLHLSFLFGLFPQYSFSTLLPDWSIALEMQYYAAFPFLMWLFRKHGFFGSAVAVAFGTLLIRKYVMHLPSVISGASFFPEPSFLPLKLLLFLVGMLVAEAMRLRDQAWRHSMPLLALAFLIAAHESFCVAAAASATVLILSGSTTRISKFMHALLSNRFTRLLADTSYSVYLVHGLFISLVGGWLYSIPSIATLPGSMRVPILTAVTIVGSYSLGWCLFRFVESPGIDLGRAAMRRIAARRVNRPPQVQLHS